MRLFWPTVDMLLDAPAWTPPVGAALRPEWFRPIGPAPRGAGSITLDTCSLEATGGSRGTVHRQDAQSPEIAVFCFSGGELAGNVVVRGSRPAAILFANDGFVSARIDARAAGARAGGAGLGAHPGGGGGFAAPGGASAAATGGTRYGLNEAFETGSGGQSGDSTGGLGGGGLQIGARGSLVLGGASVRVDGFAARAAEQGTAGGGGSGGSIVLHGSEVRLDRETRLSARGGRGGEGRCGANGGGGGSGGFILGVTAPAGIFDPGGARVDCNGGAGGRVVGLGKPGEPGGCGVTLLSGERKVARRPLRAATAVLERALAWG